MSHVCESGQKNGAHKERDSNVPSQDSLGREFGFLLLCTFLLHFHKHLFSSLFAISGFLLNGLTVFKNRGDDGAGLALVDAAGKMVRGCVNQALFMLPGIGMDVFPLVTPFSLPKLSSHLTLDCLKLFFSISTFRFEYCIIAPINSYHNVGSTTT